MEREPIIYQEIKHYFDIVESYLDEKKIELAMETAKRVNQLELWIFFVRKSFEKGILNKDLALDLIRETEKNAQFNNDELIAEILSINIITGQDLINLKNDL